MLKQPSTLVIVPAYNEQGMIGGTIQSIRAFTDSPILVIDDGSSDETANVARRSGALVIQHPLNLGYGSALQTGYKYALREGYWAVVQLDADGQHDASYIPTLLRPVLEGRVDVAVGSRRLGGHDYSMPLGRRVGQSLFSLIASAVVGWRVTDVTSGYQAMNREVVRFHASDLFPVDFPDANTLIALHRAGFRVCEVGVRMFPNAENKSMHSGLRAALFYAFKMSLAVLVALCRMRRSQGV